MATEIDWDWYYEPGMHFGDDGRKASGCRAMKQALVDNGFGDGIVLDNSYWGSKTTTRTKEFQAREAIKGDGIVGRVTARHLFRMYDVATEKKYGIPNHLVGRQCAWESGNDPVAQSQGGDQGRSQINPPSHPQVTLAQMWDPKFASNFDGSYLHGAFIFVGGNWDGAVAAYNVGGQLAKEWVAAGTPDTGGPRIVVGGHEEDGFAHCTDYVLHVMDSNY